MLEDSLRPIKVPFLPELSLWLADSSSPWWHMHPDQLADTAFADPYWAFCWPGGAALARFILDHPERVRNRLVYDIGAGCGVVGLAAKRAGAKEVIANDIDTWSLWAAQKNAELNQLSLRVSGENLIGQELPAASLIVLGDMLYAAEQSREIITWCNNLKEQGCDILVADPCRGFGLPDTTVIAWATVASEVDRGDGLYRTRVGIWEFTGSSRRSEV